MRRHARSTSPQCWLRAAACCCSNKHVTLPNHLLSLQVFVNAQARTIDLATVLAQGSGLLVLVSPGMKQQLAQRLDKHIFPGDQVGARCV